MNVIGCNEIEHDVTQKPVPTFWHHALSRQHACGVIAFPEVMVFCAVDVLKLGHMPVSGFVMQARRTIPTVPHPSETIRLVKAFLVITCSVERQRLIEYAERVATEHGVVEIIEVATDNDEQDI